MPHLPRDARVGGEGSFLDGYDGTRWPRRRRRRRPIDDQRGVAPGRERLQEPALLAIEAVARALVRGAVPAQICDPLEPALTLLIEIGVMQKAAAVDEIAAQVADGPLDFPLRLLDTDGTRAA